MNVRWTLKQRRVSAERRHAQIASSILSELSENFVLEIFVGFNFGELALLLQLVGVCHPVLSVFSEVEAVAK